MASVQIKDGIIKIDTHTMSDEEKQGILRICIELSTGTATMDIVREVEYDD